jgi:hypothetical protein
MTTVELIQARLQGLGLDVPTESELTFSISRAENYIKSFCNISTIPQALNFALAEIACGYFLQDGMLLNNISGIDISVGQEKSISEGDVSVSYGDVTSAEDKIKNLIDSMFKNSKTELIKYRKLVW